MSEKPNKTLTGAGASVPNKMRLYATWVDRTPSNCIPRLCSLTLTRLVLLKPLGSDLSSISIAVKMQSSKRTLRSNELTLPQNGLLDTPLDVTFCLQYPHFLKREGNKLHILLQRRKRYKNRTMLGFKTLAEGVIRMDQVLQRQMDIELELLPESSGKDNKVSGPVARLTVLQLSSTPVDHDQKIREHDFSDDDDEISSGGRGGDLDNPSDIQALFQELESLSCDEDSGGEQDTMSISSTPKPSLRPFFSSSRSLLDSNTLPYIEAEKIEDKTCSGSDGNADICFTDPEAQSDPQTGSPPREQSGGSRKHTGENEFANIMQELSERKSKLFRSSASSAKKKNSLSVSSEPAVESVVVRKIFFESVSKLLPLEDNTLPESVVMMTGPDSIIMPLSVRFAPQHKVFQPISAVEVKSVLNALFNKIHKYCNNCAKPGTYVKLLLIGGDTLIGWFVRPYVELLSSKPSEWLAYTRVYIVPLGNCNISRHLAMLDPGYQTLFPNEQELKIDELSQRLQRYLSSPLSAPVAQLPIGEAMLTCHDENSQLFIPFVSEVRVGPADLALSISVDLDDLMCSSPPAPSLTPPSSPNVQARDSPWEPLDLQLDYWQLPKFSDSTIKTDKTKQDGKTSLKAIFRGLQVSPTTHSGLNVTMLLANKEKKQKIMRLGKKKEKEKDMEPRSQNVEGVSRLICSARAAHTSPMKVYIDGVEFGGVKFFQLSSTWQTHVKSLTVALAGVPLASTEMN
ncbi:phosphofurin acidic cluster sorting protein 1 isoform X3 [Anoplophora glabripennis]|uniref:phosphofurin acidic cluster sorting protein 1 isoform X3 n=1 Tax=Anoplophora glabripennis TaxID=217634 RepID=UPI000875A464|nr:phosphofurin acidic cluster sorting protein 1 isoform X3 [Anoplophora glabripennis]